MVLPTTVLGRKTRVTIIADGSILFACAFFCLCWRELVKWFDLDCTSSSPKIVMNLNLEF